MDEKGKQKAEADPWAKNIFAVTLFTENLDKSKKFYEEVFGLSLVFEGDTSAVFKIGETLINLLKISSADELVTPAKVGSADVGARLVFTVHVEDVDAMCQKLIAQGVELVNGPMDRPWGIRSASFKDPSGHIWEIAK
jgi:catechol 2,3-dioxygenase-like lactoylglutathione lyase family enzyme